MGPPTSPCDPSWRAGCITKGACPVRKGASGNLPALAVETRPTTYQVTVTLTALRDYLRAHPDVARAYGELKKSLALESCEDIDGYVDRKTDMILGILRAVGFSSPQLAAIERMNRRPAAGDSPGGG